MSTSLIFLKKKLSRQRILKPLRVIKFLTFYKIISFSKRFSLSLKEFPTYTGTFLQNISTLISSNDIFYITSIVIKLSM